MRSTGTLEGREKAFISHLQNSWPLVSWDLKELEHLSSLLGKPSENRPLQNSDLLSLDPGQDKLLCSQLLQVYTWPNMPQCHAGLASGLQHQQSLKCAVTQMGVSAKRQPKVQPTALVLLPQCVEDVISCVDGMFPEVSIQFSRPVGGRSAMLLVTLGKALNVIVVIQSLFIARTIMRAVP